MADNDPGHTGDPPGPIEATSWPDRLQANVVQPGARPRIHGYDVQDDLARHYRFAEVVLTALTGKAPDEATGLAFETVLIFLSPIPVSEAPSHAAGLARLVGSKTSGVIGVGSVALAEQARYHMDQHRDLLNWLDQPGSSFPEAHRAQDPQEREAVERLLRILAPSGIIPPVFEQDPTLQASLLGVLHACGIERPEHLEAVWCIARMACTLAEALSVKPGDFMNYPMDLPPFRYTEDEPP